MESWKKEKNGKTMRRKTEKQKYKTKEKTKN